MTCKLCTKNKPLQNSHIIPEFLYKPLYDNNHKLQQLNKINGPQKAYKRIRPLQKGLREKLLCHDCEQLLNDRYEKYFNQKWFEAKTLPQELKNESSIRISGLDYGKFKLFHLSILFRASISSLPEFKQITLGPHEEFLRKIIINDLPGLDQEYPILCHALTKNNDEIQHGLITNPFRLRQLDGYTSYGFCFGGCVWYYIVDNRKINKFSKFMLTSNGEISIIRMLWEDFL